MPTGIRLPRSVAARRLLVGIVVLLIVACMAGLVARVTRSTRGVPSTVTASSSPSAAPVPTRPGTRPSPMATSGGTVAAPPATSDPVVYAKAFAKALWTYDTRTDAQPAYLAGLADWLTKESAYADPGSVEAQVPSASLWAELHAEGQYATATVSEGHLPAAFAQEIAQDPSVLRTAYVYAVTVTGTQDIVWNGGGSGAEQKILTVAVQCRPGHDCALSSIATTPVP